MAILGLVSTSGKMQVYPDIFRHPHLHNYDYVSVLKCSLLEFGRFDVKNKYSKLEIMIGRNCKILFT